MLSPRRWMVAARSIPHRAADGAWSRWKVVSDQSRAVRLCSALGFPGPPGLLVTKLELGDPSASEALPQTNKIRGNKIFSRKAAKSAKEEEGLFRRGLFSREGAKEEEGPVRRWLFWAGFRLDDGVYRSIECDEQGRLSSPLLGLTLVLWKGVYRGIEGTWLRWADADGVLLPTDAEVAHASAERERKKAEQERQNAVQERRKAKRATRKAKQETRRADEEMARAERAEHGGVDRDALAGGDESSLLASNKPACRSESVQSQM